MYMHVKNSNYSQITDSTFAFCIRLMVYQVTMTNLVLYIDSILINTMYNAGIT